MIIEYNNTYRLLQSSKIKKMSKWIDKILNPTIYNVDLLVTFPFICSDTH
jgi:hypothetical protein